MSTVNHSLTCTPLSLMDGSFESVKMKKPLEAVVFKPEKVDGHQLGFKSLPTKD